MREPSVALPVGLCRRQKGETREEGGHVLEGSSQTKQKQKADSNEPAFVVSYRLFLFRSDGVCSVSADYGVRQIIEVCAVSENIIPLCASAVVGYGKI